MSAERHEHDLAAVLSILQETVRLGGVGERDLGVHVRLDDALLLMGSGISAFTGVVSEMHSLLPTEPGGTRPAADTLHAILQRIPRTRADYDWSVGSESGFAATFPFFDTAYLRWWRAQPDVGKQRPHPRNGLGRELGRLGGGRRARHGRGRGHVVVDRVG